MACGLQHKTSDNLKQALIPKTFNAHLHAILLRRAQVHHSKDTTKHCLYAQNPDYSTETSDLKLILFPW